MVAALNREDHEQKRVKMMSEQNEMEKIVTPMVEDICDHLCRFSKEVADQEVLEGICAECQMGKYVCLILNTYNSTGQLQTAAEVVRNEFMQKGDWYRAFVNSIYGYLHEADGSIPYDQMAKELADRIVGVEQMELDEGKNMEEKTCETCGNRCNSLCDECKFYDGVECHQQADECRECTRGQNWTPENKDLMDERAGDRFN